MHGATFHGIPFTNNTEHETVISLLYLGDTLTSSFISLWTLLLLIEFYLKFVRIFLINS